MSDEVKALSAASDVLGEIMMALGNRRLLAKGVQNPVMRTALEKKTRTDEQLEELAASAFEATVLALAAAGEPVSIFECGKKDITP